MKPLEGGGGQKGSKMALNKTEEAKFQSMLADKVKEWQKVAVEVVICWECRSVARGPKVKIVQGYEFCCEECSQKFFSGKAVA